MIGYYGLDDETAATIDASGWLHMGDVGEMDGRGYLRITGRAKDMIIRGGLNLYPAEIEAALTDHPAIEAAAVIGVPDEVWGEQIGAILMLRAGHPRPPVDELTDYLRGQLAAHKTPVHWAFRDELPMTASGKIQKFVLREEVVKGLLTFDETRASGERCTEPTSRG
jgi:fatty-acyl-CoA synthase